MLLCNSHASLHQSYPSAPSRLGVPFNPPPHFPSPLLNIDQLSYNFSFLTVPFVLAPGDASSPLTLPNIAGRDGIRYHLARVC